MFSTELSNRADHNSQHVLFVDNLTSADHQLPEWPSVLKFDKFGQTDYLTAHFLERSDFVLVTGNEQIRVQSTETEVKGAVNP